MIGCSEPGPMDQHNEELLANAHPVDWENPTPTGRYNMVVIGAGTAGLVTAAGVAGLGGKVALIERKLFGGDCLNFGCVPSKTLIAASRAAAEVRRAGRFGVKPATGEVDFPAVMERLRRVRGRISHHESPREGYRVRPPHRPRSRPGPGGAAEDPAWVAADAVGTEQDPTGISCPPRGPAIRR